MICLDFDWQIDEFMVYCRSTQLREKTMKSYEQTLRLFERWCQEQMEITTVDKVTESRCQSAVCKDSPHRPCRTAALPESANY